MPRIAMPNLLLERYVGGQCREVWQDLVALGAAVRSDIYYPDAKEVAAETMKRARHNVESIVRKLDTLGYKFGSPQDQAPVFQDPFAKMQSIMGSLVMPGVAPGMPGILSMDRSEMIKNTLARMAQYREPGFEPRDGHEAMMAQMAKGMEAMRAQVAQRAPQVAEARAAAEAARKKYQDKPSLENPGVFDPSTKKTLKRLDRLENEVNGPLPMSVRSWHEHVGGVSLVGKHEAIAPDGNSDSRDALTVFSLEESEELMKFMMSEDDEYEDLEFYLWAEDGDQYSMKVPDPAADAEIVGLQDRTFVEHLRTTFAWGGFPGWERASQRPHKELDYLREGLLPL
jgi:hypothetical protein